MGATALISEKLGDLSGMDDLGGEARKEVLALAKKKLRHCS